MLQVNPRFRDLIPPLTAEELAQLEANCLTDGIMHPIIVWNNVIIDGHNRWGIVQKHGLDYSTEAKDFETENDAIQWIITHQLGRRNLNAYNRGVLALQLEGVFKEKAQANKVASGENFGRGAEKVCLISDKPFEKVDTKKEVAKIANLGHDTIAKVKAIEAKATPEVKAQLATGDLTINKAYQEIRNAEKKEERKAEIQRQVEQIEAGELPTLTGKYHVVSIDPPWPYGREYDPETSRVANPYPEMSIEQIKNIELPLAENAVLFFWTTHAFLPHAFEIAKHWGVEYKATIVWNKDKMGMGVWLRMQCEFCLVCIKGKPFWDNTKHRDIILEARREHSRKPDGFYNLIAETCEGRKLEYFSREARDGWDIFGNDINKF